MVYFMSKCCKNVQTRSAYPIGVFKKDMKNHDHYSHIGSDNSTPEDRILRYGKFSYAR